MQIWIEYVIILSVDFMGGMEKVVGVCILFFIMLFFFILIKYILFYWIVEGFVFYFYKVCLIMFMVMKVWGINGMMKMGFLSKMILCVCDVMVGYMVWFNGQFINSGGFWILGDIYSFVDVSWVVFLFCLEEIGWLLYYIEMCGLDVVVDYYVVLKQCFSWIRVIENYCYLIIE